MEPNLDIHEVYKDDEVITVKLRVKDYKVLVKVIERERSLGIVAKYLLTISGGIITMVTLFQTGVIKRIFG